MKIEAVTAVFCPKDEKLIPITDCEATHCKYFAYYTYHNAQPVRTNCKFEKEAVQVLEVV